MHSLKLTDLVDIPQLQELMDLFFEATAVPSAILDAEGTILTASGWQDICVKFHRANPVCEERCKKSDMYIARHLGQGETHVMYECANGLVDVANPIIVNGTHVGTMFTGQFLLEPPDEIYFRQQAREMGFDEAAYMEALAKVPIVSRERITPTLNYLSMFTAMLADLGSKRLQLLEAEKSRTHLQEQILEAQQQAIQELSTPLMPITDTVLVMPLVGTIDSRRAQQIIQRLLEGVAEHRAEVAIIDITGVQMVDTQVANVLLEAAQSTRLLGTQVLLTGISPTLAQTLVQLGADMSGIITRGTLQAGIAYATAGRFKTNGTSAPHTAR
jgi:anti-anti-sigma regulatory factor/ligand-binding sensor protein